MRTYRVGTNEKNEMGDEGNSQERSYAILATMRRARAAAGRRTEKSDKSDTKGGSLRGKTAVTRWRGYGCN